MADDEKVFRLTWIFDGKRYTADLNEAAANSIKAGKAVEAADLNLTNITVTNAKKRADAKKAEADATAQATRAQLSAVNAALTGSGPTERYLTSISRQTREQDRLRASYDQIGNTITKAQRDIGVATTIIERNGVASKEGAEAVNLLAAATLRLNQAQAARRTVANDDPGVLKEVINQYNAALNAAQNYARSGIDPLIAKHQQATASARQMANELHAVDQAFKNGVIGEQQYLLLNERIIDSYNDSTVAARRAAEERARLISTSRGQQNAQNSQDFFNTTLGVNDNVSKSARESADAFEEQLSAMERLETEAQRIKDALNPIIPIQREYNDTVQRLKTLLDADKLSLTEYNQAEKLAATNMQATISAHKVLGAAARESAASIKEAAEANKLLEESAQGVRDSLNPLAAIQRGYEEELRKLKTLLDNDKISLDEFSAAEKRAAQAAQTKSDATPERRAAIQEYERLSAAAQQYKEKLNPLVEIQGRYRKAIADVTAMEKVGLVTRLEADATLDTFVAKEKAVTAALQQSNRQMLSAQQITKQYSNVIREAQKDFVAFGSTSNNAFGLQRQGLLSLQAAGVNTFQSLASGISPMRTIQTEGAQVLGAFVQMGLSLKTLAAVVTPIALLATGFIALIARLVTTNQNLRDFKIQLDTVGQGSNATAGGLQKVVDRLQAAGFNADDAKKSVEGLLNLQPKGLVANIENIEKISRLGLDISAREPGSNPAEKVLELGKALTGGVDGLRDYAIAQGLFNDATDESKQKLLAYINSMEAKKNVDKTSMIVLQELINLYNGKFKESQTEAGKALDTLGTRFRSLFDTLNNSSVLKGFFDFIADNIKKDIDLISSLVTKLEFIPSALNRIKNSTITSDMLGNPVVVNKSDTTSTSNAVGKTAVSNWLSGRTSGLSTGGERLSIPATIKIDTPDLERIAKTLGEASKLLPEGFSARFTSTERTNATVAGTGGVSQHAFGRAADVEILDELGKRVPGFMSRDITGIYRKFEENAKKIYQELFPDDLLITGTTFKDEDAGHFMTAKGGTRTPKDTTTTGATLVGPAVGVIEEETKRINKSYEDRIKPLQALGTEQRALAVQTETYNQLLEKGVPETVALALAEKARVNELKLINQEVQNTSTIEDKRIAGTIRSTEAMLENEGVGLRSIAMEKGRIEQILLGGDATKRASQALEEQSTTAVLSAAQQLQANEPIIKRQEDLADAARQGAAAEHDQMVQNEAHAKTYDVLLKAQTSYQQAVESGTEADKARTKIVLDLAQREDALALGQVRRADLSQQRLQVDHILQQNKDQSEILALQVKLQGETTEEITKRVAIAQTEQFINNQVKDAGVEYNDALRKSVVNMQDLNITLSNARREAERLNNFFLDIANTIGTTISNAITDAFSGDQVKSWKDKINDAIKDILKTTSEQLFTKPLLGTLADTLGFSTAAQSLGTISGTTSSIGKTTTTAVSGIGGNVTTGALGLGASLGLGSESGTATSFINEKIGPALGFAAPDKTTVTDEGTDFSGTSGTTLTSALGSAATGLGAGATVSSLVGGNTKVGSAGGLVGGLLGSLTGIPGGSFIGGALGGLTGLFGNNKTSNNAAGANLNLATGKLSQTVSSDEASTQDVKDITGDVRTFTKDLLKQTGGDIAGDISVQSGLRDGIKVAFTGALSGLGEMKFDSAEEAIDKIELEIAKGLTGISDTAKTVIDQITDPADLQAALDFADTYDNLKEAADEAFTSITEDTDAMGPYAEAMDLLTDKFDEITDSATEFGLSLDPVNDALDEATKRLQDDFTASLDAALDSSTAKDYIATLNDVSDAFVSNLKEADAIGLGDDTETTGKIAKLEVAKARETTDTLSAQELRTAYDELITEAPEIAALLSDALAEMKDNFSDILDDAGESDFVTTLKDVHDTFVENTKDAAALNLALDENTNKKIRDLEVDKARETLKDLTDTELQDVYDSLITTAPEIALLASSMIGLGDAAKDTADSINSSKDSMDDLIKSLRTGELSGLTGTGETKAAIRQYEDDLKAAQDAGAEVTSKMLDALTDSANDAVQSSLDTYGNAPKTADLRRRVISDLKDVSAAAKDAADNIDKKDTTIPSTVAVSQSNEAYNAYLDYYNPPITGSATDIPATVATEQTKIIDDTLVAAAAGDAYTKPGLIMVGEKGPEWMFSRYAEGGQGWRKVGKNGPEIIDQKGGATILPFPMQPNDIQKYDGGTVRDIRKYSEGTIPAYNMGTMMPRAYEDGTFPVIQDTTLPSIESSTTTNNKESMSDLISELRSLRGENKSMREDMIAVKKQIQGGQVQAMNDARTGNSRLASIDGKLGSGLVTPVRRAVG